MDGHPSLTSLDVELRRLHDEADFAEATYGLTHAAGLRHVHGELTQVMVVVYSHTKAARDLTLRKRDRRAIARHADAIIVALHADLVAVEARYAKVIHGGRPVAPGARGRVEAVVARSRVLVDNWWEGRLRLGPLTSPAIAAQDWTKYRTWGL